MSLIIALSLWLLGLISGQVLTDEMRPRFPGDCTAWEDGSVICEAFELPAYDDEGIRE